mmetsp:Transcript_12263/g.14007  ORF Transcript_12263/g.14007 Transcript_12263/m.14007 type:complete len:124 (+) Transcript_12263:857-1228(+)
MTNVDIVLEYINNQLDNFLPQYEELNERITSTQEEIAKIMSLLQLMKTNPEYKENLDFIEETIRCLQDEEERLQVFQSDMENESVQQNGSAINVVKTGVQWQVSKFKGLKFEDIREMRRLFGG